MYALLALISKKGAVRSLRCLPEAWREILDKLQSDFPNFAEVVDYLRGQFSLGDPGEPIVTFDPFLLDGPPGVGKSFFAEELGRRLDVPCKAIRMENAQSNARLVGSDEFWSNSKPGAIFDTLMQGDIANPLFFLDEVEKAAGASRYDPISGLYSLLERATAKSFVDLSWPWLELDASHVNWILASNEVGRLPEPIRSRIRIFSIPAPTSAQGQRIVVKMFRQLQREISIAKDIRLTWGAVRVLSGYPPRTIKKRLREAIGRAAYEQRRHIREQDLRDMETQRPKRSIGFVAG
jgi:ATP-dependent Lon protease